MSAQLALALPADVDEPTEPEAGTAEAKVLALLRQGDVFRREWARQRLVDYTHMRDREIRRAISNLIEMGHPIASNSRRFGYFLATTPESLAPAIADCKSRVNKLTNRYGALERAQRALLARTA
jgi:hypothetical protein